MVKELSNRERLAKIKRMKGQYCALPVVKMSIVNNMKSLEQEIERLLEKEHEES